MILKNVGFQVTKNNQLIGLVALALLFGNVSSIAADDSYQGVTPPSIEKISSAIEQARQSQTTQKSAYRTKLGPTLQALMAETDKAPSAFQHPFLRTKGGDSVQVYIQLKSTSNTAVESLRSFGVEIDLVNNSLNKAQGWVSTSLLSELSQQKNVVRVTRPEYATPNVGRVTTQGDAILRANKLREMGITGEGIRVGIISDGANSWTSARASGDLPQNITTFGSCTTRSANPSQCLSRLTCNEGTAMAEIIHDMAPDAELAVAAVSTSLEFISQINRLANTFKANIIVDDLGFFGEPYFQDGDLARAVAGLPASVLYVSSAGNSAASHYERDYRKFPADTNIHDFGTQEGAGPDDAMGFLVPASRGTVALLQWNDSFSNPSSNYDLYIFNSDGVITQQSNFTGGPAIEGVCVPNAGGADIVRFAVVDKRSGSGRRLEMFFLGAGAIEYPISRGSIFGHPGVTRAIAVASINASDAGNNSIAFYSSRGPAQRGRAKPDLSGIDGVSVTGAGGFPSTFFGTSAAAPHVAGVAALLMSASPKNTTALVREAMLRTAVDLGSSGRDSTFGFGRVDALNAIAQLDIEKPVNLGHLMLLLLDE